MLPPGREGGVYRGRAAAGLLVGVFGVADRSSRVPPGPPWGRGACVLCLGSTRRLKRTPGGSFGSFMPSVHTHTFSSARTRPPRRAALPSARRAPLVRTKAIKRHLARARRTPDSHPAPPSMASRGPHALTGRGERQVSRPAAQGRAGAEDAADAADASTTAHVPTSQSCSQHGFNFLWLSWFPLWCCCARRRRGGTESGGGRARSPHPPAPRNDKRPRRRRRA